MLLRPGEGLLSIKKLGNKLLATEDLVKDFWLQRTWWRPVEGLLVIEDLLMVI